MAIFNSSHFQNAVVAASAYEANIEGEKSVMKAVIRRTVDPAGPYIRLLQSRFYQRTPAEARAMQPTIAGGLEILPPLGYPAKPATSFNTKFVSSNLNKMKSPVNVVTWTPEGRRLMTGTQGGEFSLWHGTTFHFETVLQAHEAPVRAMTWSHDETWLLTSDDTGCLKYWRPNLEFMQDVAAHKEPVRAVTFAPSDRKFATASDDSTLKVWDFATCKAQAVLSGHGGDVKAGEWHPQRALLASGSKDGLVKLWDAKGGAALATLHGHNNTVTQVTWNANGHWLLTASRDQVCKVFEIRMQKELASFKGHNRDVMCAQWHPLHEELFASGAYDGSLIFWLLSRPDPQAEVRGAHEGAIMTLRWHPLGHLLATGSNDWHTKFWARTRPGDGWRDAHQALQEQGATMEGGVLPRKSPASKPPVMPAMLAGRVAAIPGIGEGVSPAPAPYKPVRQPAGEGLPGLDIDYGSGRPSSSGSQPHPQPQWGSQREDHKKRGYQEAFPAGQAAQGGGRGRGKIMRPDHAGSAPGRPYQQLQPWPPPAGHGPQTGGYGATGQPSSAAGVPAMAHQTHTGGSLPAAWQQPQPQQQPVQVQHPMQSQQQQQSGQNSSQQHARPPGQQFPAPGRGSGRY